MPLKITVSYYFHSKKMLFKCSKFPMQCNFQVIHLVGKSTFFENDPYRAYQIPNTLLLGHPRLVSVRIKVFTVAREPTGEAYCSFSDL